MSPDPDYKGKVSTNIMATIGSVLVDNLIVCHQYANLALSGVERLILTPPTTSYSLRMHRRDNEPKLAWRTLGYLTSWRSFA